MPGTTPSKLHIGVLLLGEVQYLDTGPIDLFALAGQRYMRMSSLSDAIVAKGIADLTITYVGEADEPRVSTVNVAGGGGASSPLHLVPTSAFATVQVTQLLHAGAEPPLYDILIVPGPEVVRVPSETVQALIRKHAETPGVDLLTVCSGVVPVAHSGVLDGIEATGPRPFVPNRLRSMFPKVLWDDSRRWVANLEKGIWTSGIITNGNDMVAAYIKEKWDPALAEYVCITADVGDRPVEYPTKEIQGLHIWG